MTVVVKPKQRLLETEKDAEWKKSNLLYFNKRLIRQPLEIAKMDKAYKNAAGVIEENDYNYVTNPLGSVEKRNYPAKLLNYDIKSPIYMQLLGEFLKRVIEPVVFAKNSNIDNLKAQKELELLTQRLQQIFVNTLIENGKFIPGQTGEDGKPLQPPISPELIKKEKESIRDIKSINGQNVLDYIFNHQQVIRKFVNQFYDFIVTKKCYSYRGVDRDDVIYKRVNPYRFFYEFNEDIEFIEDANAVKHVSFLPLNALIDLFKDEPEFTDEIIDELEKLQVGQYNSNTMGAYGVVYNETQASQSDGHNIDSGINNTFINFPVAHIEWASLRKVGRIYTVDIFGNSVHYDVDEDYIPNEEEKIEWKWAKEMREGYVLANKWVFGGNPIDLQRGSFENPNNCKSSYNGKIYMKQFKHIKTIDEAIDPYQENYNILKYRITQIINKNKDKIVVMPIGLFGHFKKEHQVEKPDGSIVMHSSSNDVSAIEEGLYYVDSTGFLFIDETEEGSLEAAQNIKSVDVSLSQYVQQLFNYAAQVKSEAEELVGFNRFRKANTNSSDAVSNVNQGQYVGSLITEMLFTEFNSFIECDCQALLDIAKYAYRDGKKGQFLRTETEVGVLELEAGSLQEIEFGVFVKNGGKIKEDYELLKQRTLEFAQNGMKPSMVGRIISSNSNYASLMEEIDNMEREMEKNQQAQAQAEQAMQTEKLSAEMQNNEANRTLEYYKIEQDNKTKIDIAFGQLSADALAGDGGEAAAAKIEEVRGKLMLEYQKDKTKRLDILIKAGLKERELASKERIEDKKVSIAKIND